MGNNFSLSVPFFLSFFRLYFAQNAIYKYSLNISAREFFLSSFFLAK